MRDRFACLVIPSLAVRAAACSSSASGGASAAAGGSGSKTETVQLLSWWFKAGISTAIGTFGKILTDYVDVTKSKAASYGWAEAAQDVHDGNAAMILHGDWAKGYFVHQGWSPGVDFGLSGPPGANDLFVFGADVFGLPSSAPDPVAADAFLSVVASADGQVAFNRYKGATPMRSEVRDRLDDLGKASMDALLNAKVLSPSHANSAWDDAIGAFSNDGDQAALLDVYLTTAP